MRLEWELPDHFGTKLSSIGSGFPNNKCPGAAYFRNIIGTQFSGRMLGRNVLCSPPSIPRTKTTRAISVNLSSPRGDVPSFQGATNPRGDRFLFPLANGRKQIGKG